MAVQHLLEVKAKCDKCGKEISDRTIDGWFFSPDDLLETLAHREGWEVDGESALCPECKGGQDA